MKTIENPISPAEQSQVDLVLANTVSRLGCTVQQAREYLAKQSAAANSTQPYKAAKQPASKSDDETLL